MKNLKIWCTQFVSTVLMAGLILTHVSCQPVCQKIEPIIVTPLPTHRINSLPSAFPKLTAEEFEQEWAKELIIGDVFAKESDFYRAITSYKRALILIPLFKKDRLLQLNYNILLSYYLGGKYQEAINLFEGTDLCQVEPSFPAFNNLLILVYDSYLHTNQEEKAACALKVIHKFSPETADDLLLYQTIKGGEVVETSHLISQHRDVDKLKIDLACYHQFAKSPRTARTLNALLPGAGYYYVGQKRSAVTSFLINALFTAAAYQFFRNGYQAAGAITASLEIGWYLGGINGAGLEAQLFNTRLFEGLGRKILTEHEYFPVLMFETSF